MNRSLYQPRAADLEAPLFLRIARGISEDVRRGRLRPGESLPGSRELSKRLGVHRNTVLAALRELEQEGWLQTEPRRGTFVAESFPERPARPFAPRGGEGPVEFELPASLPVEPYPPPPPGMLALLGGVPDLRLAPRAALARAYRRVLTRNAALLGYGSPRGQPALVRSLLRSLAETRGVAASEEELLVTRGSQMALHVAARALLSPGDCVAVEQYGYRSAWEAIRLAGGELAPVPVDGEGVSIAALEKLVERQRVRALYLTPHHQYPTTVTLTAPRRLELLALARRHRFVIIEDDYDHEYHYDGRPVLPLASVDPHVCVYVGTTSKVLAPGLRLGYLVAPEPITTRALRIRQYLDRQGDLVLEAAVAELYEDGELGRHLFRVRRQYHERRDALVEALRRELAGALSFEVPRGGMALWAKLEIPDASARRLTELCRERQVLVQPAARFHFDDRDAPYLRLGFAALRPAELARAVTRLATAVEDLRRERRPRRVSSPSARSTANR